MAQKNRNRRPLSTLVGCWDALWKKPAVQKNRDRRPLPTRRILSLEALEDRTLLSGNVLATLNPNSGVLTITGDAGNNSITISQTAPGVLEVGGVYKPGSPPDITKVNGRNVVDFNLSAITSLNINMGSGNDTVVMGGAGTAGFSVPGSISIMDANGNDSTSLTGISASSLSITDGSGSDTISTTGVSASTITINAAGPGNDSVTMNNTNAGSVTTKLGTGADTVNMDNSNGGKGGLKIGTLKIDTSASTVKDSVSITNFASVVSGKNSVPGIGNLTVTSTGSSNHTLNVSNASFSSATLTTGSGYSNVNVNGTNTLTTMKLTTGGGGSVSYTNSTASSATVNVGPGGGAVYVSNNTTTGSAGLTVNVGTGGSYVYANNNTTKGAGSMSVSVGAAGNSATDNVWANNNNVAGSMTVQALDDGLQYWELPSHNYPNGRILPSSNLYMSADNVGGTLTVTTGNYFRNVTVGSDNETEYVSAAVLNASIGSGKPLTSNSETVLFNTHVSGNETITVGSFNPSQPPIPLLTPSSFTLGGNAGSLTLKVGANAAGGVYQNANVSGTECVSVGANAGIVNVLRPTAGNSTITLNGATGPVTVTGDDDAGDAPLKETIMLKGTYTSPVTIGGNLYASGGGNWTESIAMSDYTTLNANVNVFGAGSSETIMSPTGNGDTVNVNATTVSGPLTITLPGTYNTVSFNPDSDNVTTVGSLAVTTGDNASISVNGLTTTGGNVGVGAGNGASISLDSVNSAGGNVSVTALDGASIYLESVNTAGGNVGVGAGNGASIYLEGVNLNSANDTSGNLTVSALNNASYIGLDNVTADYGTVGVTAGDNTGTIAVTNSSASSMNVNNGDASDTGSPFILLDQLTVGALLYGSGLNVTTGTGNNTIQLGGPDSTTDFLSVLGGLNVTCAPPNDPNNPNVNSVFAANVFADFGTVDGGGGSSSVFDDFGVGNNFGFVVQGFVGYPEPI